MRRSESGEDRESNRTKDVDSLVKRRAISRRMYNKYYICTLFCAAFYAVLYAVPACKFQTEKSLCSFSIASLHVKPPMFSAKKWAFGQFGEDLYPNVVQGSRMKEE